MPAHRLSGEWWPQGASFLLYPVADVSKVEARLDGHHAASKWVSAIAPDLHPYVVACLRGAGLDTGQE